MKTMLDLDQVIGQSQSTAMAAIQRAGLAIKFAEAGMPSCLTADNRLDRVTLVVQQGVVTHASFG